MRATAQVFGKHLVDQPLMQRVLADMALDVAAATALSFRLARILRRGGRRPRRGRASRRLMTPVVKYWVCKMAPALIYEAMECLGGNGYVEEAPLPRLLSRGAGQRDLGGLRQRHGARRAARAAARAGPVRDGAGRHRAAISAPAAPGTSACCRRRCRSPRRRGLGPHPDRAAGAVGRRRGTPAAGRRRIADAFIETRLGRPWRTTYGMLDSRLNFSYIIDLLYPAT